MSLAPWPLSPEMPSDGPNVLRLRWKVLRLERMTSSSSSPRRRSMSERSQSSVSRRVCGSGRAGVSRVWRGGDQPSPVLTPRGAHCGAVGAQQLGLEDELG
jgi:hypothetical protein